MTDINDATQLIAMGRDVSLPFRLAIEQGQVLEAKQVLRHLPAKRLTLLAEYQGQQLVAKLFFDKKSFARHAKRDAKGIKLLQKAGINTPGLIYAGASQCPGIHVVLIDYLADAQPLSVLWLQASEAEKDKIMQQMMVLMAAMHEKCIVHKDLHLNNFLVADDKLYIIDGDGIRRYHRSKPLTIFSSLKNLGLLLSHLPLVDKHRIHTAFKNYCALRSLKEVGNAVKLFNALLLLIEQQRMRSWHKKVFRDCTAVIKNKSWRYRGLYQRDQHDAELQQFINELEQHIDEEAIIKNGNSSTVAKKQELVIKRYNMKSLWHRIKRACQPSRAAISWRNSQSLQMLDIATAKPIAMLEHRWGLLRGKAYFISEYLPGDDLLTLMANNQDQCEHYINATVCSLKQLKQSGHSHGDLKASNIIIHDGKAKLIDLDSMRYHGKQASLERAWRKDVNRLLKNWQDNPGIQSMLHKQLVSHQLIR